MATKNECGKIRDLENPYEIWKGQVSIMGDVLNMEWRVLKKYQSPEKEAENEYAIWFVAAQSEATFGGWDYGDTYVKDITNFGERVK